MLCVSFICVLFQTENKKYRAERTRLIEERNNNYSKIRALYAKEDEIKKEIATLRGDISANRKCKTSKKQNRIVPSWYRVQDIVGKFLDISLDSTGSTTCALNNLGPALLPVQLLISCDNYGQS